VLEKRGDWPPDTAAPGKFVPPVQHRQYAVRLAHDGYVAVLLEAGSAGPEPGDKSSVALIITPIDDTSTGITSADKSPAKVDGTGGEPFFELVWPTPPLTSTASRAGDGKLGHEQPVTVSHSWPAKAGQWYAVVPWVPFGWCWKGDRTFKLWAAGEKPLPLSGLPSFDEAVSGAVRSAVLDWEVLPDAHPVEREDW